MAPRDSYAASLKAAAATKTVSDLNAEMVKQVSINQSGCDVGLKLQNGNAAFVAATKAANTAYFASLQSNEATKQQTVMVAKDTLKSTGDNGST
jgi:hypothetical protein